MLDKSEKGDDKIQRADLIAGKCMNRRSSGEEKLYDWQGSWRQKERSNLEFAAFSSILTDTPDKIVENYVVTPIFYFDM